MAQEEMITIPRELYNSLLEAIDILTDREEVRSFTKGFQDIDKGRVITLKELKRRSKPPK